MAAITRRTSLNLDGFDPVKTVKVDSHAHVLSYGTGTIEGVSLTLSSDGTHLCIMDPYAHAGRHILGAKMLEADKVTERELQGKDWCLPISPDDLYKMARKHPNKVGAIQILDRRINPTKLVDLNVGKYVKLLIQLVMMNLESPKVVLPNYGRPVIFRSDRTTDLKKASIGVLSLAHAWQMFIDGYQWPREYMGAGTSEKGASVMVASTVLHDTPGELGFLKHIGNYGPKRVPVKNAAKNLGFDDAIILGYNSDGQLIVTEMTGANLFFVKDGALHTPELNRMILAGITRVNILDLAYLLTRELGLKGVIQSNYLLSDFLNADEVFATGSAAKITPISSIGVYDKVRAEFVKHKIGGDTPGKITRALQAAYFFMERSEPFVFGETRVDEFVPRVKKVKIPGNKQELAARQLGLLTHQNFDTRFRPPKSGRSEHSRRFQTPAIALRT